ncbi:MAG: UDP-glucuronic acid decarboxylase family protein [Candidatus Micrarchaeota archaeon]
MRILVTGGAGFIGSHLCESLVGKHEVVCIDNLITGKKENIDGFNVEFVKHDIRKPFDIRCDLALNMASPASPVDYQLYPLETLEVNSLGMRNVLENARKHGARVVHASTSETYGDPLEHPQRENYFGNVNALGPRSCYDESKRFAETMCYVYNKKFGVEAILVRIFNTYGERMRLNDGRVVPNFITQALKGEPLTVYGDGTQTRSLCYVGDLVSGIEKLAFSTIKFDVFNLGNPHEVTVNEIAKTVSELCGSKSKLAYAPLPQDDPKKRRPDISKVRKAVGWEPKVEMQEGLTRTVAWFRKGME